MNTDCNGCIFAKFNDRPYQIGCHLGRIEMLRVLETLDDRTYIMTTEANDSSESNSQSLVLLNRLCNTKRTIEWVNKNKTPEAALAEIQTSFTVCIDYRGEQDIEQTILSALRQEIRPAKIMIFNFSPNFSSKELKDSCKTLGPNLLHQCKIISYKEDFQTVVDQTLKSQKTFYFCFLKPGDILPNSIFLNIDTLRNKLLQQIVAFVDNPFIIQSLFYFKQDIPENGDLWSMPSKIREDHPNSKNILVLNE